MNQRRREQKAKARRERIRLEKHERRAMPGPDFPGEADAGDSQELPSLPRHAAERSLYDLHSVLDSRTFENEEELSAALAELNSSGNLDRLAREKRANDAKARAQDLAYRAMEAENIKDIAYLIRQALELDPNCTDALRLLTEIVPFDSLDKRIEMLQHIVEDAEREFGDAFFDENMGHFWGVFETRPYMRARYELASLLQDAGRYEEAIDHFETMLRLNPDDNQAVRDQLICMYLAENRLDRLPRIFEEFDEPRAVMLWGRVLYHFLRGDMEAAAERLAAARKRNRHMEKYLTGEKQVTNSSLPFYQIGEDSEAQVAAGAQLFAWKRHPEAVKWLARNAKMELP